MLFKKLLVLTSCMTFMAATVSAAPLTNFDTNKGSLDLGVWNTDTVVNHGDDFSGLNRFNGGLTVGVGGPWGLQYRYFGMKTKPNTYSTVIPDPIGEYSSHFKGSTNEFNVLYSLGKNSRVALFAGVNKVSGEFITSSAIPGLSSTQKGSESILQGGLVATIPLSKSVDAYALAGFGSHKLRQAELGISAKLSDDWQANVGYRGFHVNHLDDTLSVKTKGITFGATYLFGKKAAAVVPPVVVVQPPVIVQPPVVVQPPVQRVVLQSILFDFDKDTLQQQAYPLLAKVIDVANKNPNWTYLLVGNTDSKGTDAYNMDLSLRRVKTVQNYLINQGIPSRLLTIDEKGEGQPIATNETEEGRAQNRRVEIHIN
ncbi:MAG: OmpA family protein [Sporomusaceae bacterium]|nr:OmpA family protein [Sporomusaceae bacterium]